VGGRTQVDDAQILVHARGLCGGRDDDEALRVRPFEDDLAERPADPARDRPENGVKGASRVHGDRPFLGGFFFFGFGFDTQSATRSQCDFREPTCVKGKGERGKEKWGNAREGAISFGHDAVLCGKFQDVLPRRVVVRVDADLQYLFLECSGVRGEEVAHLVHGREHLSHFDDAPQPFEGKVAHPDAPMGCRQRQRGRDPAHCRRWSLSVPS
jgi:hypothetical protein